MVVALVVFRQCLKYLSGSTERGRARPLQLDIESIKRDRSVSLYCDGIQTCLGGALTRGQEHWFTVRNDQGVLEMG